MTAPIKEKIPSEHHEQVIVNRYCLIRKIPMFAIPNGTYLNGTTLQRAKQMNHLKAEGLRKGVPDLFIPVAKKGYHGLFIEMKRIKGSTTSKEQKEWIALLELQGYKAVVCKGSEEAIEVIEEYMR